MGTIDAVRRELTDGGLVKRYQTTETNDGLKGGEGLFIACSFWLVDALHAAGPVCRVVEADERACRGRWLRPAMTPPSAFQMAPVTQLVAGESRKVMVLARSQTVPTRPSGWKPSKLCRVSSIWPDAWRAATTAVERGRHGAGRVELAAALLTAAAADPDLPGRRDRSGGRRPSGGAGG